MTDADIEIDDLPSRSQLKRDSQALRDLGEKLVLMPNAHLDKITMDSSLLEAIKEARRLKNLDARRRQIQYIGKLMRNMDLTDIRYAIEKLNHQSQTFRQHFAMLEHWRDRLIEKGNDAIDASRGGFNGDGKTKLGRGDDVISGFGSGSFSGGGGTDTISLGEGVYEFDSSAKTLTSDGTTMNLRKVEEIKGFNDMQSLSLIDGEYVIDSSNMLVQTPAFPLL